MRVKRKLALLLAAVLFLPLVLGTGEAAAANDSAANGFVTADEEFRGMWVATVLNLDYPSKSGLSVAAMKTEAIRILDNCKSMGFNAVVFQVRPSGDALYKSSIFPWSEVLTGTQGRAPEGGFDPLKFWIDEAHARGLELHAWINPFRVARSSHDISKLAASNPARKNPALVVKHADGHMYLNPGLPEARKLVIDGVREIVTNYDVDGIHYDDYFYPSANFGDSAAYTAHGKGYSNIEDWRRDNITALIRETQAVVRAAGGDIDFGVAPFAIWANKSKNSLGSDTNGNQSYYSHYADTRKWVKEGLLDYICPQIYWEIGYKIADYKKVLDWWVDVCRDTSVKLYVGHASYRSGSDKAGDPWQGTVELSRQLTMNAQNPVVQGSIHFRYKFFETVPGLSDCVTSFHLTSTPMQQTGPYPQMAVPPQSGIVVGRPESDIRTSHDKYYVLGRSDPSKPLYLNGQLVEGRTYDGYFGVYVTLKSGANKLTFTQNGSSVTRTITRGGSSGSGSSNKMNRAEIVEGSTYPNVYDEYRMPGETVTFKCTAPIGATVNVTLAGKTYSLKPATTKKPGNGIYSTTFSYTYTLPAQSATGRVINLGTPVYTMSYNGQTSKRVATGDVQCITQGAPYFATVTADNAFLFAKNSTSGGPVGELRAGMVDNITAVTNGGEWVRLGMGYWIKRADVERAHGAGSGATQISAPRYDVGPKYDVFSVALTRMNTAKVDYDAKARTITLTISNANGAPKIAPPSGALFKSAEVSVKNGRAAYRFTLADGAVFDGYGLSHVDGRLQLNIKRRPQAATGATPLSGLVIVLDPGHGGSDTGALGPLGAKLAEKHIVLTASEKLKIELERLGATVYMTRTADVDTLLVDRLNFARSKTPDLLLSMHNNAVEVNVNSATVRGVSTWYKEAVSADFAKSIYDYFRADLGTYTRGVHQSNLYISRGTFCPSVILECGFICNPGDYSWLTNDAAQTRMAQSVANGVVDYFRN